MRFRIRSEDGKNIVSNVLELTTGKYNFMMDFRNQQIQKKYGSSVLRSPTPPIITLAQNGDGTARTLQKTEFPTRRKRWCWRTASAM